MVYWCVTHKGNICMQLYCKGSENYQNAWLNGILALKTNFILNICNLNAHYNLAIEAQTITTLSDRTILGAMHSCSLPNIVLFPSQY